MLSLFYILIHNVDENDPDLNLKKLLYETLYMDNGGLTSNGSMVEDFKKLPEIFNPYKFELQEFASNDRTLMESHPNIFESKPHKLLGMQWDTSSDTLSPNKYKLESSADTKRKILSTIASNYDLLNIGGPILNRARLFMHGLQNDQLGWDKKIEKDKLKEWKNISKQLNDSPEISIDRSMGSRDSRYSLVAYVDASKHIYGCVLYLYDKSTKKFNFLLAKNRIISNHLKSKSIAALELLAVEFGTKVVQKLYKELCGDKTIFKIKIEELKVFSDSSISLDWIRSHNLTFEKMNKKPIFIMNRLNSIAKLCENVPVQFSFIAGMENPADCITRALSYKVLVKSNFWSGPKSVAKNIDPIIVPNPKLTNRDFLVNTVAAEISPPLLDHERFSSFRRVSRVYFNVIRFCAKLVQKVSKRKNLQTSLPTGGEELWKRAQFEVLADDQSKFYPEIVEYFSKFGKTKTIPNLISQLNIFKDDQGILRVKSKISHIGREMYDFPVLLHKESSLTRSIVLDVHKRMNHAGKYSVLAELRKNFYLPHGFSVTRKILKECVICRRFNNRTIALNQNSYRNFRLSPENVPYRNVFIDMLGPYQVKIKGEVQKVYLLIFSCLWSRSIDLQICLDLTVKNFLRAYGLHVLRHGLPSLCLSDEGSQIVPGTRIISGILEDADTKQYLLENGIKSVKFEQYAKGCNKLGGLIESCVKLVKRLIYGAIGKSHVNYSDFEVLVAECVLIVNKRPICLKPALRDNDTNEDVPVALTPELIVNGYELVSVFTIPHDEDEWKPPGSPESLFGNLSKIRAELYKVYEEEFLNTLVTQATDLPGRYQPVSHKWLKVGDIVLIKENFIKRANLPMARVLEVKENSLGEVTEAVLKKGNTREIVRRHVESLIPFLEPTSCSSSGEQNKIVPPPPSVVRRRPQRAAHAAAREKISALSERDLA